MNDKLVLQGMGSILHAGGVAFRVGAPHAQQISIIGAFNDWNGTANPMKLEEHGYWYADVEGANVGDNYKYWLITEEGVITRIDPYAR